MATKQRFFHATRMQNIPGIQKEGLKAIWDFVYLTDSLESAQRWMGWRIKAMGDSVFAVVEVEADPAKLQEGTDHSPMMVNIFGVGKSFTTDAVPKSRVKKIHYFQFNTVDIGIQSKKK